PFGPETWAGGPRKAASSTQRPIPHFGKEERSMTVTRRDLLKGAALAGAAAALPGGLARPAAAQTTQKRELVVAQGGDIAALQPHMSTSSNAIRISFNVFDTLTSRRPDGKLVAGLATEWKIQGQQAWAFKLRQGVKWHNGDPFTSADVKYIIERDSEIEK